MTIVGRELTMKAVSSALCKPKLLNNSNKDSHLNCSVIARDTRVKNFMQKTDISVNKKVFLPKNVEVKYNTRAVPRDFSWGGSGRIFCWAEHLLALLPQ